MQAAVKTPKSQETGSHASRQPFFNKGSKDGVFQRQKEEQKSFFPGVQTKLAVGAPGDRYEQEADHVATKVIQRLAAPGISRAETDKDIQKKCAACEGKEQVAKKEEEVSGKENEKDDTKILRLVDGEKEETISKKPLGGTVPETDQRFEQELKTSKGAGSELPKPVRSQMETAMGADLSGVRIHTGNKAAQMSESIHAQAFTHGNHIFFNEGKYNPGSTAGQHLLAHELTHTIQQGGAVRRKEKQEKPETVQKTEVAAGAVHIQRDALGDAWDATGGQLVDAAGEALEFTETLFWEVVERLGGSGLSSILRQIQAEGAFNFFKNKMLAAVDHVFDGLQNTAGAISIIFPQFSELLTRAQTIIAALAQGDCGPLFAALEELKGVVTEMAGQAWEAITEFFQPAIDFFTDVWNSIALPALEWLQNKAAAVWEGIKQVAAFIWQGFWPVREAVSAAWDWMQRMLGLNADETGEEGLIQWAGRKVEEVWQEVKALIAPIIEPARQIVANITAFIPLAAILNLRQTIQEWMAQAVATSTAMGADASNIGNEAAQTSLRDQIIPAVRQSINGLKGSVSQATAWVNGQVGQIFASISGFFSTVRSIPLLSAASGAVEWLEAKAMEVNDWCQTQVTGLFDLINRGLDYLSAFLTPIYDALQKIVSVLGDLLGKLPDFILGPVWLILPECIKNPIKQFFIDQILSRVSFFQKLKAAEDIWQKIQDMAVVALKQIFVDGDLGKAIWTFYSTMLDVIGVPPQLVTRVIAKGAQAFSDILADPLGFLGHFIHALKLGLEQFFGNIGKHLLNGFQAWLLSKLEGTGIEMPKDVTFKSMLKLAFQVLGITVDMLLRKLEEVTGKKGLKQKIEKYIGVAAGAWDWFEKILTQSGEGGSIWDKLEKAVGNIWNMVMDAVIGWLEQTIVVKALAWIAQKLDPTGIMAIISTIIDAFNIFQTIVEKAREILEMVERVLDDIGALIKGIIAKAANVLEGAMGAAIPVALAIMASLFGLNDVVDKVKEVIAELRQKVEDGIANIMQRVKGWIEKLFGTKEEDSGDSIEKALQEIETEAEHEEDEGEVTMNEAELIKSKVNQDHAAVIDISSVADGGETWDFEYIQKKSKKVPKTAIPESTPAQFKGLHAGAFGTGMNIDILSSKPGKNQGSKPPASGKSSDLWQILVMRRNMESRSYYVQGHLLNENMGGPGSAENLAPITQTANSQHLNSIEKKVKTGIGQGKVYSYTVWAEYGRALNAQLIRMIDGEMQNLGAQAQTADTKVKISDLQLIKMIIQAEVNVPKALVFTADELKLKDGEWKPDKSAGQDAIHVDTDDKSVDDIHELTDLYL
jgi:hypothetical protein